MRIALLAPFEEPVPPKKYGGTERVVYSLAEELVRLGHDVTLLASGDSKTKANLIPCVKKAVRVLPVARDPNARHALNLSGLANALHYIQHNGYDIVHNHIGWQTLMFKNLIRTPVVTTIHGTLDKTREPSEHFLHSVYNNFPYISISKAQRRHLPNLHYVGNVYNGINVHNFSFNDSPEDYLAFLGRIHPDKGPEQAIEIAKKSKNRLVIAAKVDPIDEEYFQRNVRPKIDGKQIIFIGEIGHRDKVRLLKNAKAMLMPIQWHEPFGIATIEAMACGTPVIAMNKGSMPEIIVHEKTGFLCNSIDQMVERIKDIELIDRSACRERVSRHFSSEMMAEDYLKIYLRLIKQYHRWLERAAASTSRFVI